MSGEESDVRGLLEAAMAAHGAETGESELRALLSWMSREVPPADAMAVYDPARWAAAGAKLREQSTRGDPAASSLLPAWGAAVRFIAKRVGSKDAAEPSGPPVPAAAAPAEPGKDHPAEPRASSAGGAPEPGSPDPRDAWRSIREGAEKEGDVELLLALNAACPVPYEERRGARWTGLSFTLIKELRKAVLDFGLTSPYAKKLLESVMRSYPLYPYDCRVLAEVILSPIQYVFWSMRWEEAAACTADGYLRRAHGDPVRLVGVDALLGKGPYAPAAAQAQLPVTALQDAREAALRAFLKVPDEGKPQRSASSLRQGPTEPFVQFIDKLRDVLDKQVRDENAKELLLKTFAMENANEDCRKMLEPLNNPTLAQMIEACKSVGTISHQCSVIASAVAALHISQQSCFSCGQPGHIKRNCPARRRERGPGVCPRRHWRGQCQ